MTKGKRTFPHIFVILLIIIIAATLLTYFIPAGEYSRMIDPNTGREVIDPDSFHYIESSPVGPFQMFLSIIKGMNEVSSIVFLIFMAFSSLYIVEKTGAIDASIAWMVKKTQKNPRYGSWMIALCVIIFSVWSSTGTFSYEEILAFIPIFVSLGIALGYDAIVGLAISFVPVGIGFASATVNPFTIGVAQGISELPLFSGIGLRIAVLVVMTIVSLLYIVNYAKKVKDDPEKSYVSDLDFGELEIDTERLNTELTMARKFVLVDLFIFIGVVIYGLINLGWYINEISACFIIMAIIAGFISRWNPSKIANSFVEGLSKAVLSAMVVGVARGILVVIRSGQILDTIIHSFATLLGSLGTYLSAYGMLLFQSILNFLIPSGSGQAATSMPIMSALSDVIGINRQIAVLAFQFGDGFSNLLWPTGFLLIACALARIPVNKYYKFFIPLFGILLVVQVIFMTIAVYIGYGPF